MALLLQQIINTVDLSISPRHKPICLLTGYKQCAVNTLMHAAEGGGGGGGLLFKNFTKSTAL